jgi:DNA-binding IclR family transcriptional regulator
MEKRYIAPSVKKAFDILKVISASRGGIRLNEIAKELGIAKSTVHGVMSILEDVGVVRKDTATRRFELGLTLFELGRKAYSRIDLREIARPVMEALMELVQETVFLGTLSGDKGAILVLDVVECSHDMKVTSPVGSTLPLFAAAPGKAIMANMDEETVMEIIKNKGLPRLTGNSITDPGVFMKEIRRVKKRGYAADLEEYISGLRAVAAPLDLEGHGLSTIYIVGFKKSLDNAKMDLIKSEIVKSAGVIHNLYMKPMNKQIVN